MKTSHIAAIAIGVFLLPIIVSAQTIYPPRGGTGSTVTPTKGQVLVGQSNGTYAPQATSTLGISGSGSGGSVTSVAMTVPTGLTVAGSPITTSGTFAVTLGSGYTIPLSASVADWNTAFGWGDHASAGYLTNLSSFDTDDLTEGSVNEYFTDARAISALTGQHLSIFVNDAGFITSADDSVSGGELDGVFSTTGLLKRSGAGTYVTVTDSSSEWNTAYGWGNHSTAGYLTSSAIGSTIQAYDADLTTYAGITPSANVQSLLGAADYSAMRSLLGIGSIGLLSSVDISANTNLAAGRSLTMSGDSVEADAELYTDTKTIYFEAPVATDDFKTLWTAPQAATITAISCESDQTVNFDLQVDDGSPTGVNGSDIACTTFATDSSLSGDTTLASGDRLDLAVTSVSGTPTWVSISFRFTYDD